MRRQQIYGYKSKRTCIREDHKDEQILQICTYDKCDLTSRWACAECMKINLHTHNNTKQVYLNNQNQYLAFLHKKKIELNKQKEQFTNQIQNISSQLKELINQVYMLQNLLPNLEILNINNNNIQQLEQMIYQANQDFFFISNEQIKQTEKINNNEIVFEYKQWMEFEQKTQIMLDKFKNINEQLNKQQGQDKQKNSKQINNNQDHQNKLQNQALANQNQSQNVIRFINVQQINRINEQPKEIQANTEQQAIKLLECPLSTSDIRYFQAFKTDQQNLNYQKDDPRPYAQSQVQKIQQQQQLTQIQSMHTAEQKKQSELRGYSANQQQIRDKSSSMGLKTFDNKSGQTNVPNIQKNK